MDDATKSNAEKLALRHLITDLEESNRFQNRVLVILTAMIGVACLTALYVVYKLDQLQFLTNVMG